MFKLNHGHLRNDSFMGAVQKIGNYSRFEDPRVAYNAAKIMRKIQNEAKFSQEQFVKLVEQYALLDDKGKIKPRAMPDGKPVPGTYEIDPAKFEAWEKALEAFHAIEFEVPCHKIMLGDTKGIGLTPFDLSELEPMINEALPAAAAAQPKPSPLAAVPPQPSAPN